MNEYTGMTAKGEGRSQVYAQILADEVTLHLSEETGFTVEFDKSPTQVLVAKQCRERMAYRGGEMGGIPLHY